MSIFRLTSSKDTKHNLPASQELRKIHRENFLFLEVKFDVTGFMRKFSFRSGGEMNYSVWERTLI